TDQSLRQTIAQPAPSAGKYLHIMPFKPDFFVQFTIKRVFRRLLRVDSTLRKLPGILVNTSSP
ncbi:hypothetical protein A245_33768, partial [Pseudomonas syringae pv. actinidiae ICMP 19096]